MTRSIFSALPSALTLCRASAITLAVCAFAGKALAQAGNYPITPDQRSTAKRVAQDILKARLPDLAPADVFVPVQPRAAIALAVI